jgi:FSR family fosmidomycin resistance protein-like MFS transporter
MKQHTRINTLSMNGSQLTIATSNALATEQVAVADHATRRFAIGNGLVMVLALAHVANDAIASMLATLLPHLQDRFHLSEATLALLVATFSFSSSVMQPLFGALSDRFGRRPLAVFGLSLGAGLLSLTAIVPSIWTLFALLLIGGLGSAAFHPAGTSLARSASTRKEVAVGMFSAGGMLGLAMGPVIVLAIAGSMGIQYTPWLMAPAIILGVIVHFIAPKHSPAQTGPKQKLIDWRLLAGPIGKLSLSGVLMELAFVTFVSAFPLWLANERGIPRDGSLLGWTLTVFYVSAALGGSISGLLGRRFSRRLLIAGSMIAAPLPMFALFATDAGSAIYFLLVAIAGALINMSLPLMIVRAQELAPHAEATASGMLMGLTVGAAGVLYAVIGWLQQTIGFEAAMSIGYLMAIPGGIVAAITLKQKRQNLNPSAESIITGPDVCACYA